MTDHAPSNPNAFNLPAGFTANRFPPELEAVYRHLFIALRREAEARPGLAMLRTMVAERAAMTFTRLKQFDQAERVYQPDYARAAKDLTQIVNNLLAATKGDDDDDSHVRLVASEMLRSLIEAIDSAKDDGLIDDDSRSELLQRFRQAIDRSAMA